MAKLTILSDEQFDEKEAAQRRDEVVRRMANTAPQPKATAARPAKRKTKAAAGHAARKGRVRREV